MPPLTRAEARVAQHRGEPRRVLHDLLLILRERRLGRFLGNTALPAMMRRQRTTLDAGNTLRFGSEFLAAENHAAACRASRSVLCVVVVAKVGCGTGLGCTPPAARPCAPCRS